MNPLEQRTILVQLRISTWTGRKKDKLTTEEVLSSAQADKDAGSWWTYLVPKSTITAIETKAHQIRHIHYRYTLPWTDNARILTLEAFLDYQEELSKAIAEFNHIVSKFLEQYPNKIEEYKQRLGKLGQTVSLPSVAEIKNRFSVHLDTLPFPTQDFRLDVTNQALEEQIRSQVESTINNRVASAARELYQRLFEMVSKIKQSLDKKLRQASVDNLNQFCDLLPKLNFTKDKEIDTLSASLKTLFEDVKAEEVRKNKVLQHNIKTQLETLVEKIQQKIKE